jgi:protein TonB
MKKTLLIIVFVCGIAAAKAQQAATVVINTPIPSTPISAADSNKVFTTVDQEPMPQGGIPGFYKYLEKNLHYPEDAKKKNLQGKVFLTFVVEKDGSITDVKVLRGISPDIDAEAIRVISNSPKWNPGTQDGKPVRVQYVVPLSFALQVK